MIDHFKPCPPGLPRPDADDDLTALPQRRCLRGVRDKIRDHLHDLALRAERVGTTKVLHRDGRLPGDHWRQEAHHVLHDAQEADPVLLRCRLGERGHLPDDLDDAMATRLGVLQCLDGVVQLPSPVIVVSGAALSGLIAPITFPEPRSRNA